MIFSPKRTFVIVACSTLVGCSNPALPATMLDTPDQPLRLYATQATLPLVTDLTNAYSDRIIQLEVHSGSLRTALDALRGGDVSYIVSSHLPPQDNAQRPLWAAPIAQDGLALIVNNANRIQSLSLDDIRDLYQGRIKNWREVGGSNLDVVLFSPEHAADTRLEFEQLVMGSSRAITLAARLASSPQSALENVAETPGGLAYVPLSALSGPNTSANIRVLQIDGVSATSFNVAQNRYPLRSTIFIIGLQEPEGSLRVFFGWIQSADGQAVARQQFTPLSY
jgi:phosphate transport system substrate-binding protein